MIRRWLAPVRAEVRGERALADIHAVTRFHRIQSTPGYVEAADWLRGELDRSGLGHETVEAVGDGRTRYLGMVSPEGWACRSAVATLLDGRARLPLADFEAEPLSLVQRSAPGAGRFPVVALEDGTEAEHYRGLDVRGRVVLTSGAAHRVHTLAVIERGAAGLICDGRRLFPPVREADTDAEALPYTSFWWAGDEPRGWGVVVSPARGAALRERLRSGAALELEVAIDTRRFEARVPLVTATLPGERPGEVLVTSHLCHPRPGANDNGSGVAATLETARALRALAASGVLPRDRLTVRFLWMPEFTGTHAWMTLRPGAVRATVAALNLDMVGERQDDCGSTFLIERAPHPMGSVMEDLLAVIRHEAQDWVESYSGPGHFSMTRMSEVPYSGGSDHAVWLDPAAGVPCPMLIQWPDRYYHASSDTPERCDPRSLAHTARTAALYAAVLATAGADEAGALLALAGRAARRRLFGALESEQAAERTAAELRRGHAAIASCARVATTEGAFPAALADAHESLQAFFESEVAPELRLPRPPGDAEPGSPVPVRLLPAPLDLQRHLLPGWDRATSDEREAWRRHDAAMPGGTAASDIAWALADGTRSVHAIAETLRLEGHGASPEDVQRLFVRTEALALSGWEAEPGFSGPASAAPPPRP